MADSAAVSSPAVADEPQRTVRAAVHILQGEGAALSASAVASDSATATASCTNTVHSTESSHTPSGDDAAAAVDAQAAASRWRGTPAEHRHVPSENAWARNASSGATWSAPTAGPRDAPASHLLNALRGGQAMLIKTVYVGPPKPEAPMVKGFCKPSCTTPDNLRALSCFKALLKAYATMVPNNEEERMMQKCAELFVGSIDGLDFSLCTRTYMYKISCPEAYLPEVLRALHVLELPVVMPMAPSRRDRGWMVICPDGAPVSHVVRQIHKLGGTEIVADFNTSGLVKRGRCVALYFNRLWAPSSIDEVRSRCGVRAPLDAGR